MLSQTQSSLVQSKTNVHVGGPSSKFKKNVLSLKLLHYFKLKSKTDCTPFGD